MAIVRSRVALRGAGELASTTYVQKFVRCREARVSDDDRIVAGLRRMASVFSTGHCPTVASAPLSFPGHHAQLILLFKFLSGSSDEIRRPARQVFSVPPGQCPASRTGNISFSEFFVYADRHVSSRTTSSSATSREIALLSSNWRTSRVGVQVTGD